MKIAVVNPRGYQEQPEKWMQLGAATIATVLRNEGHQVKLYDEEIFPANCDTGVILNWADVLCLSGMSHQVAGIQRWLSKANGRVDKIIVGGVHASLCANPGKEFDGAVVVCGPGEEMVLQALKLGPGIILRTDALDDLNAYPWPDRERFGWSAYSENMDGIPAIRVIGSRGCPYACRYCSNKRLSGGRLRMRDPDQIAREIAESKDRLKIRAVVFAMATFTATKRWTMKMCDQMKGLGVQWKATTRVDLMDLEMARKMKVSGCVGLGFGVESGDNGILKVLGKNTTVDQARSAFDVCKQVGLPTWAMFMTHVPGETPATLEKTKKFARELSPPLGNTFQRFSPMPGSWFWEQIGKWGVITARNGRGFGPVGFTPHAFVGQE